MLSATVPVDATAYAAHGRLTGDGQVFDLDLTANERACRLTFLALDGIGGEVIYEAIGRMVPEAGWTFSADLPGQGLVTASGTHVTLSLNEGNPTASWQAWVRLEFTQNYESA